MENNKNNELSIDELNSVTGGTNHGGFLKNWQNVLSGSRKNGYIDATNTIEDPLLDNNSLTQQRNTLS